MRRFIISTMLCGLAVVMAGSISVPLTAGCLTVPDYTWVCPSTWQHGTVGVVGYSVWLPQSYSSSTKYPVLMYLHHASGAYYADIPYVNLRDQAISFLTCDSVQAKYPCIIYAPQTPVLAAGNLWVNVPGAPGDWTSGTYSVTAVQQSTPMRDALAGLDTIIKKYSVDTNRIYVAGGSMGGYGTWDILSRGYGKKFACAVPVGGAGDTSKARDFKSLPVWAFANDEDGVIPPKFAKDMIAKMQSAGGTPKYTWYNNSKIAAANKSNYPFEPGSGHMFVLPFALEPTLMDWICAQSKSTTPIRLHELAHVPLASVHHTRFVVNLARSGASAVSIRFFEAGREIAREFDTQGRPVCVRLTGR